MNYYHLVLMRNFFKARVLTLDISQAKSCKLLNMKFYYRTLHNY